MMVTESAPGRARHVLANYLPMVTLAIVLIAVGLTPHQLHYGRIPLGNLFLLLGVVLLVLAVFGMLFTRCEKDFVRWRILCYRGHDVRRDRDGYYYRELVDDDAATD
jgi:ABC-type transport system involved in cytochrome c biogenesis permease subunit